MNRESHRLVAAGNRAGLEQPLGAARDALVADPLAAFTDVIETSPAENGATLRDPGCSAAFIRAVTEALGAGPDGWVDEVVALLSRGTSIRDGCRRRCRGSRRSRTATSRQAARRLVAMIPREAREWHDAGHLAGYHREPEILDELLARG